MPDFVALLRGVNVGKAKRVPMKELCALMSGLGYAEVTTLLNSGNAVFHASSGAPARHAADISAALAGRLQIDVPVVVKSARELDAIVVENPIDEAAADPSRVLVAFVQNAQALPSLAALASLAVLPERFVVGRSAAYLSCPAGILKSKVWTALVGKAGQTATTRNWATVLKLQAMLKA